MNNYRLKATYLLNLEWCLHAARVERASVRSRGGSAHPDTQTPRHPISPFSHLLPHGCQSIGLNPPGKAYKHSLACTCDAMMPAVVLYLFKIVAGYE